MEFNEYQKKATETVISLDKIKNSYVNWNIPESLWTVVGVAYSGLGLGEVGEVQNKIKKIIRDKGGEITKDDIDAIKKELGDVLWYVADMCTKFGVEMNDVADGNIKKIFGRKDRGTLLGSGDNR